jgi:hypothetical protein
MFKRKITAVLLTAVLLATASLGALAAEDGNDTADEQTTPFEYENDYGTGGLVITGYSGPGGLVVIPDTIDGKPVTRIYDFAFSDCSDLTGAAISLNMKVIDPGAFRGCDALEEITAAGGNASFSDIDGVLFSKDKTTLYLYPAGRTDASYKIPEGVTLIGSGAFYGCSSLTNVTIPDEVDIIGSEAFYGCSSLTEVTIPAGAAAVPGAFKYCGALSVIRFNHGMTEIPKYFLTEDTWASAVDIHVPMSVINAGGAGDFATTPPPGETLSRKNTIYGIKGSFILDWAAANSIDFVGIDGFITKNEGYNAWLEVPYQHIIETMMPDNAELEFEIVSGSLPSGLHLMQKGDSYAGLTMAAGQFYGAPGETGDFPFEVNVRSKTWGYLLDMQRLTVRVKEPTDAILASSVNDYDLSINIGTPMSQQGDGDYLVSTRENQVLKVEDSAGATESNYNYFVHFWLDGNVLTRDYDYSALPGSTIVTLFARVLPGLNDGKTHTVAAEFDIGGEQKVAAQMFRVDLPPLPPGGNGSGSTETNTSAETPSAPAPESEPRTDAGDNSGESAGAGTSEDGGESAASSANAAEGASGANNPGAAGAPNGADANGAASAPAPSDTEAFPALPAATESANANASGALADGEAGTGEYTVNYDGTGPFEVRIDIPMELFREMYFDGEIWARGEDYELRSGSTVITIPEARLAKVSEGSHTIRAVFEDRDVDVVFAVQRDARDKAFPVIPITGLILIVCAALVFGLRLRGRGK